jgi:hypothetical protein
MGDQGGETTRLDDLERRVKELEGHVKALASALNSLLEAVKGLDSERQGDASQDG